MATGHVYPFHTVDPPCKLCGRIYAAHSFDTRDICNFYLEPGNDVRGTMPDREGDTRGKGQGGMVPGDAAGQEDLRGTKIAESLQKLADACRVKADLYAQAHQEIPASFRTIAVEIENIIAGRRRII